MHRPHEHATILCSMISFDQSFVPFMCSPVSLHLNGVSHVQLRSKAGVQHAQTQTWSVSFIAHLKLRQKLGWGPR